MSIYLRASEEEIAEGLMRDGLLDVLGVIAGELSEKGMRDMVDDQYSGSIMHDSIPCFLRRLADEMEGRAE